MPLYEFVCQDCEQTQELLLQGEQQPVCESCGGSRLTKLLSLPVAHAPSSGPNTPPAGSCGSGCGCFPQ